MSLEQELRAAGIPRGRRARILAELDDHLRCDPHADLGDPRALARQFADELGTAFARRAAVAVFAALVPLGLLFAVLFAEFATVTTNVPAVVTTTLVLGPQVAFVGGALALLRALRLRRMPIVPAQEAMILLRRSLLGLAGGGATIAAIAFAAANPGVQWRTEALAWGTVAVGAATLSAAALSTVRAMRLHPAMDGGIGDLSFDLGVRLPAWRLAVAIAGGVALCIAGAGVVQGDPLDGIARAILDGGLCLVGFAALGRWLGLRR